MKTVPALQEIGGRRDVGAYVLHYNPPGLCYSNILHFTLQSSACTHTHTTEVKVPQSNVNHHYVGCTLIFPIPFLFLGVTH